MRPTKGKVLIYALCHPETKEIRYVGKTKMDTHRRLLGHLEEKGKTRKVRWVAFLKKQGLLPELIILEEVDEQEWKVAEQQWIIHCRLLGYDLVNLTDGGDGVHNPSEEARQHLSTVLKEKYANDPEYRTAVIERMRSPEKRAATSKFHKGREHTSEQIAKRAETMRGWKPNEQQKENMRLAQQQRTAKEIANGTFNLGKREITEQQRVKISIASRERKYPNRRRWTEEEKHKRSLATKGRPHTLAHSQAIAKGQKRRWERQRQEKEKTHDITVFGLWDSFTDDPAI